MLWWTKELKAESLRSEGLLCVEEWWDEGKGEAKQGGSYTPELLMTHHTSSPFNLGTLNPETLNDT